MFILVFTKIQEKDLFTLFWVVSFYKTCLKKKDRKKKRKENKPPYQVVTNFVVLWLFQLKDNAIVMLIGDSLSCQMPCKYEGATRGENSSTSCPSQPHHCLHHLLVICSSGRDGALMLCLSLPHDRT